MKVWVSQVTEDVVRRHGASVGRRFHLPGSRISGTYYEVDFPSLETFLENFDSDRVRI